MNSQNHIKQQRVQAFVQNDQKPVDQLKIQSKSLNLELQTYESKTLS